MSVDKPTTEQRDSRLIGIQDRPVGENLRDIHRGQVEAVSAISDILEDMEVTVEVAAQRLRGTQGRLIYIGAGTSGRLGVQDGIELKPTFGWNRVDYAMAGGFEALTRSIEGAEDDAEEGARRMAELNVGPNDVCIGVAASGTTPYTVAALKAARDAGALTIGFASNETCPLLDAAEHGFFLDSGTETVSGSTRMNAGTAQKVVLNKFSTATMIALGRVYDGFMVFVQPTCDKLVRRSQHIIQQITGCSPDVAERAFNASAELGDEERRVPSAILAVYGRMSVEDASTHLKFHGDHFGNAIKALPKPPELSARLVQSKS